VEQERKLLESYPELLLYISVAVMLKLNQQGDSSKTHLRKGYFPITPTSRSTDTVVFVNVDLYSVN
jgi:hypothetical protein